VLEEESDDGQERADDHADEEQDGQCVLEVVCFGLHLFVEEVDESTDKELQVRLQEEPDERVEEQLPLEEIVDLRRSLIVDRQ